MPLTWQYLVGDVREVLAELLDGSVQCIVTSPPYWGLRDYGIPPSIWGGDNSECEHEWGEGVVPGNYNWADKIQAEGNLDKGHQKGANKTRSKYCHKCGAWRGCLGLEPTPEQFIEHMVEVCRELWRVLRDDGTFWLNMGDCYAGGGNNKPHTGNWGVAGSQGQCLTTKPVPKNLKPKDLVMMPHRLALALQADGWYVRSTIVWDKPNPMPESCTDRPTSSHEYIFLLTKKAWYFYDADAVREEGVIPAGTLAAKGSAERRAVKGVNARPPEYKEYTGTRNLRSVWHIATQPYPEAHFATFPERIPELCIKAGTSEWGACPSCGAPWERVVEKEYVKSPVHGEGSVVGRHEPSGQNNYDGAGMPRVNLKTTTKGFQPTCECIEEWKKTPKGLAREMQGLRTPERMGHGPGWRKRESEAIDEWKRRCGADSKGEYHGKATKDYASAGAENPSEVKARILRGMVPKRTKGFQQTCDCPPELEPVPCTVLDPFVGSGTTLWVARRLGRAAIGIDISREYRELAIKRAMLDIPDILSFGEAAP